MQSLRSGVSDIETTRSGLRRILDDDNEWRRVVVRGRVRAEYGPDEFERFLTTPVMRGLGTSVEVVRRMIGDDLDLVDRLDAKLQKPTGVNNGNTQPRPVGNTQERSLRTLRSKAPAIHARVIAGELSPHAGMIEAGFRHPTFTVPADDVDRAVAAMLKRYTPDEIRAALR